MFKTSVYAQILILIVLTIVIAFMAVLVDMTVMPAFTDVVNVLKSTK